MTCIYICMSADTSHLPSGSEHNSLTLSARVAVNLSLCRVVYCELPARCLLDLLTTVRNQMKDKRNGWTANINLHNRAPYTSRTIVRRGATVVPLSFFFASCLACTRLTFEKRQCQKPILPCFPTLVYTVLYTVLHCLWGKRWKMDRLGEIKRYWCRPDSQSNVFSRKDVKYEMIERKAR